MTFRWAETTAHTFVGVLGVHTIELREEAGQIAYRSSVPSDSVVVEDLLKAHLRLDDERHRRFCAYSHAPWLNGAVLPCQRGLAEFRAAASDLPGVRVVRITSLLECVVSFVGSANNNIKRCSQMIEHLCAAFPDNRIADDAFGTPHFRFPSLAQISSLSEAALWGLGWGYRAPRLYKLVRELLALGGESFLSATVGAMNEADARAALMGFTGIGRKVADCVLLFGYAHDGCVPVDTHCFQLAERFLLPSHMIRGKGLTAGTYRAIVEQWHETFGSERAGHAFMALFVPELADFRKAIVKARAADEAAADTQPQATPKADRKVTTASTPSTPCRLHRRQREEIEAPPHPLHLDAFDTAGGKRQRRSARTRKSAYF